LTDNTSSFVFIVRQLNVHTTDITAVKKKIPLNPYVSYKNRLYHKQTGGLIAIKKLILSDGQVY